MSPRPPLSVLDARVAAHGPGTSLRGGCPRRWPTVRWAVGAVLLLAIAAAPGAALAQIWTVTPSFSLSERYTDNVFGTANDRESDFITQFTPGLALSYDARIFRLSLEYSVTGEIYAKNSDLDNFGDNQNGSVGLFYQPEERLALRLIGYYLRTNDPSRFLVPVAVPAAAAPPDAAPPPTTVIVPTVETTRTQTTAFTISAGADYRFTPQLSGRAGYAFTLLKQEDTDNSYENRGTLGADYQLTSRDAVLSTLSVSVLDATDTDTSVALLLGWRRQWTPVLVTSVAAGPRVTNGDDWGGAADVSATYQLARDWSASVAYTLGTSLSVGTTGAQNVSALTAAIGYQALRDLRFSAFGGWTRSWPLDGGPSETTNTYGVGVTASYQLTPWLSLALSYRYSLEDPENGDSITTNEVVLRLSAFYPWTLPR